jgi:hypothetical protein
MLRDEDQIFEFADSLQFSETAVGLSLLRGLPIDEPALVNNEREAIKASRRCSPAPARAPAQMAPSAKCGPHKSRPTSCMRM